MDSIVEKPRILWRIEKEHGEDGWMKITTTIIKEEYVWIGTDFDGYFTQLYTEYLGHAPEKEE